MSKSTVSKDISTTVEASQQSVLQYFQTSPEAYLSLAGLRVEREKERNEVRGSWLVSELTLPAFGIRTRYSIDWTRRDDGCEWHSIAPLGVRVTNTFVVHAANEEGKGFACVSEKATLTCSSILLPLVKRSFERAHEQIHASLKQHFEQAKRAG